MFDGNFFGLEDSHTLTKDAAPDATEPIAHAARLAWREIEESFANEVGRICSAQGIDSHSVLEQAFGNAEARSIEPSKGKKLFARPLNTSHLLEFADGQNVRTPLLTSLAASHTAQILFATETIEKMQPSRVAFLGLDDQGTEPNLIENPVLRIAFLLAAKGVDVTIYDPSLANLSKSARVKMIGVTNAAQASRLSKLPGLIAVSAEMACQGADTIVVAQATAETKEAVYRRASKQRVIDLVRIFDGKGEWDELSAHGMADYIQKPASPSSIERTIKKWSPKRDASALNILMVDDDDAFSAVTTAVIAKLGHRVMRVASGRDAILKTLSEDFDLIFMDICMPGMSGKEACERIKSIGAHQEAMPIIALTAIAAPEQSSTYRGISW